MSLRNSSVDRSNKISIKDEQNSVTSRDKREVIQRVPVVSHSKKRIAPPKALATYHSKPVYTLKGWEGPKPVLAQRRS